MTSKAISNYLTVALLTLSMIMTAGNWYLKPERAAVWAMVVLLIGCMASAWLRVSLGSKKEIVPSQERASIRTGVVFAGLILATTLSVKFALALGVVGSADLAWRSIMALSGFFLVFAGNAIPKKLRPLASVECDVARLQAFQRFAGWMWVLAGLAVSIAWMALPVSLAESISSWVLPSGMIILGVQMLRLHRTRERAI